LTGLAVLPWVAAHVASGEGSVLVHVTEPDVQVSIAGRTFEIEGMCYVPLECTLPPGRYRLEMTREGDLLYHEEFQIRSDEQVILTAWNPRSPNVAKLADRSAALIPACRGVSLASLLGAAGF
jgi:hypothetical protein